MPKLPDRDHLRWQCRRGMLELDYLFQAFLENRYETLELNDKQRFIKLLKESDEDLFRWLMESGSEAPKEYGVLLDAIKETASSR